jgi:hypothetical protein
MTVFGISPWWPLAGVAVFLALYMVVAVAGDRVTQARRRDVNDQWPKDLADGGRMDRQQRDDLLAGESVPEDPAVLRSIRRHRRKTGGAR